ncbi:MAG: TrmB family transcriptional regulator [Halobacteriota archaeon]
MSEHDAIGALKRLGLSTYEARVFVALQRLGTGSARDVARTTDVPRSQVYGAAEQLEAYGLIDLQQSDPITYRPVDLEEAKTRLRTRFERDQSTAFEYLERIQTEVDTDEEEREDIWTVTNTETIDNRVAGLIHGAADRVLFGVRSTAFVPESVRNAITAAADRGVAVTVISRDPTVGALFGGLDGVTVTAPAMAEPDTDRSGRFLAVDRTSVLLTVLESPANPEETAETAIWSTDTGFAIVLIQLIESFLISSVATEE